MENAMRYIPVGLLMLSVISGFTLGFLIPLRWHSRYAGFKGGLAVGIIITFLGGFMFGNMVGGWGEELLGQIGVPIGLLVGCFIGALVLNYVWGSIGLGVVALFRLLQK